MIRIGASRIGASDMDVDREARRQLNVLKARAVDLLVEEELYAKLRRSLSTPPTSSFRPSYLQAL